MRRVSLGAAVLLLLMLLLLPAGGAQAAVNGTVRVELASLGTPSSLTLTVRGSYAFSGSGLPALSSGDRITVSMGSSGGLKVSVNGNGYSAGSTVSLLRQSTASSCGLLLSEAHQPDCLYCGSLTVSRGENRLQAVLSIYLEDYLKGVLPWEMGEDAEPEALKAQAVAARSYTLSRMSARASEAWDVVDTVQDQVYWGYSDTFIRGNAAVEATRGIILTWQGAPAEALYTASNGGQTESASNAWGSAGYDYLKVKDDPYDIANAQSPQLTCFIPSDLTKAGETLTSLLRQKAAWALGSEDFTLQSVQSVVLHTPRYASPSLLYTQLDCAVTVRQNGADRRLTLTFDIFGELESVLGMSLNSSANELWSVVRESDGFLLTARRYGHGIGLSQRGAMLMADTGRSYDSILSFYYEGCELAQVTLSNAAGQTDVPASLPGQESGTATVSTKDGGWLNLRTAPDQTADILAFIPNGSEVTLLGQSGAWYQVRWQSMTGYVLSQFLVIHEAQAEATAQPASSYAYVNTASGGLNLRESPSADGRVLCLIPQYTIIPVYGESNGWIRTFYQGSWGYVQARYLLTQGELGVTAQPTAGVTASPTPAPAQPEAARPEPGDELPVDGGGSAVDMHVLPDASSPVMLAVPDGDNVRLEEYGSEWCCVTWQECTGYVATACLVSRPDGAEETAEEGTRAWIVTGLSGGVNLRSLPSYEGDVLAVLSGGSELTVTAQQSSWYAVSCDGRSGYVAAEFVTFSEPETENGDMESGDTESTHTASTLYVCASGYLNMRALPDLEADILQKLPRGSAVILIVDQGEWSFISYDHQMGYVLSSLLSETPPDGASETPTQTSGTDLLFDQTLHTAGGWAVVLPDEGLELRMWCKEDAPSITTLAPGALVEVREIGDTWCKINDGENEGYCLTSALSMI